MRAAGALVWREKGGDLQVLLVHRPRYNDWSFPKGKLESGESLCTCAMREVAEETGVQVRLEQPLETIRYRLGDGTRKEVRYWAARELDRGSPALAARGRIPRASRSEIDGVQWMGVKEARKRLDHAIDRDLLGSLVDLWEDDKLDTWTLVLVRHARAVKRSVWNRPKKRTAEQDEATRPLTGDHGRARARALAPILAAYGVGRAEAGAGAGDHGARPRHGPQDDPQGRREGPAHARGAGRAVHAPAGPARGHGRGRRVRPRQTAALGAQPGPLAQDGGDHGHPHGAAPARQDPRRRH